MQTFFKPMQPLIDNSESGMDAETIQKNGAILKSHTSRKKSKIMQNLGIAAMITMMIMSVMSCARQPVQKLKVDAIGFADRVETSYKKKSKPYELVDWDGRLIPSQKKAVESFIRNVKRGKYTAAYYAMDVGLDRVKHVRKRHMDKDRSSKYYIIILTDGLDNISTQLARNNRRGKYNSNDEYYFALQKKMRKAMGKSWFQSYPLLFIGDDLKQTKEQNNMSDEQFKVYLQKRLSQYAGSSNFNIPIPEVSMGENFDDIVEKFTNQFLTSSFDFVVAKGYAGKRIRMILESDKGDAAWFEGNYVKKGRKSYSFENIKYSPGFSSSVSSGGSIVALKEFNPNKKALVTKFTINSLKYNGTPFKAYFGDQSVYDAGILTINSEYKAQSGMMKNAYIMLILDASDSFSDKFENAQNTILGTINFITTGKWEN